MNSRRAANRPEGRAGDSRRRTASPEVFDPAGHSIGATGSLAGGTGTDGPGSGFGGTLAGGPGGPGAGGHFAGGPSGPAGGRGTSPDGGPARGRGSAPRDAAPDPGAVGRALAAIEAGQNSPLLDPRGSGLRPSTAMSLGSAAPGLMLAPGSDDSGMGPGSATGGAEGSSGPNGSGGAAGSPDGGGTGGTGTGADGSRIRFRPRRTLDLVVACNPQGVTIHPGGYRLSRSALAPRDSRLVGTLRGLVERRQAREPENEIRPRLTFLVEPGGQDTYWTIRKQTTYAGLDWPVHLRVAEGTTLAGPAAPLAAGEFLR